MSNHGNEEKRKNRDYFQQTKKTKIFESYRGRSNYNKLRKPCI
jgi:hypothetical protein